MTVRNQNGSTYCEHPGLALLKILAWGDVCLSSYMSHTSTACEIGCEILRAEHRVEVADFKVAQELW